MEQKTLNFHIFLASSVQVRLFLLELEVHYFFQEGAYIEMVIFYIVFAFIVLTIFNTMTTAFCIKMELSQQKQARMYRVINMILVTMLVCSYLRILNVTV